jgi:hypothetical protein
MTRRHFRDEDIVVATAVDVGDLEDVSAARWDSI